MTVNRWAFGYSRNRPAGKREHPALIATDLPEVEGRHALTFVEVIELLYVRAFSRAGLTWPVIKRAAEAAARMFNSRHPFALRHVYVDPRNVYAAVEEAGGDESLVVLAGAGQHVFSSMVKPYLHQLEFGTDSLASKWWPMERHAGIVLDPRIAFGAPIVEEVGIRTRTLTETYEAEKPLHGDRTIDYVAWMYEISPHHVEAALSFKRWLQTPVAA